MRQALEVVHRLLAMDAARFRLVLEEPSDDQELLASAMDSIRVRVDDELPRDAVMAGERAWAHAPIGALEQCDHLNISWLTECQAVFLWALGLCELPAHDQKMTVSVVDELVPLPGSPVDGLTRLALARSEQQVGTLQKLYEVVLWRLRTPPESGESGLARHIREALDGTDLSLVEGDIPLRGSPAFRHRSGDDAWRECHSIALERLRALRWLTGSLPWDEVETDVRWPEKSGAPLSDQAASAGQLNIQKLVSDLGDGAFSVRTIGLRAHRHAEIEIAPIPFGAVEAAAKLVDYVVDAVIGKGKQLKAGENVGLPLSIAGHDEIPSVFVGVHATEFEPASGGFFAKMRGTANHGVLRLTDLPGSQPGPPVHAVAAMMLHRADCRLVTGDSAGALQELRESIRMNPGDPNAGPPPAFETPGDSVLNWENHLSYLRLAELADEEEGTASYGQAYSRFGWLARRDLGCSPSELRGAPESILYEQAKNVVRLNLSHPGIAPGPHAGLRFVASPLWVAGNDGVVLREASLIPAAFVDYYFGGRLASPDVGDALARLAAQCVARNLAAPWIPSLMTKDARQMYRGSGTASAPVAGVTYRPWHFLLSAVIAEAARYVHAGATNEELHEVFGLARRRGELPPSLKSKTAAIEIWETQQYSSAMFAPS